MSLETMPDGRKALRIQIRGCDDGFTRALVSFPGEEPLALVTVHSLPHDSSPDIQAKFIARASAIVGQLVSDAVGQPVNIEEMHAVPPGGALDVTKH